MESPADHKRVHRSRSQWDEIVQAFKSTSLSQAEFCRRESLSPQMFARALARRHNAPVSGYARLLHSRPTESIVVEMPGGIRLSLRGVDPVALIRGLSR